MDLNLNEIKVFTESIAKRVYPETEKEKKCINEYGKMIINRGKLSKQIIEFVKEKVNDSTGAEKILDKGEEQSSKDN